LTTRLILVSKLLITCSDRGCSRDVLLLMARMLVSYGKIEMA
jgi:hypothetical protein